MILIIQDMILNPWTENASAWTTLGEDGCVENGTIILPGIHTMSMPLLEIDWIQTN